jgi:hypothetical protein
MFSHNFKLELIDITVRMIGGLGHLDSIFVLGVGNFTTKFQKVQMPRGMLTVYKIDWRI